MPYKVEMKYPDGTTEEEAEIFETSEEAHAYGQLQCSEYKAGGEVLHSSNPGDYPLNEGADYEVLQVDA